MMDDMNEEHILIPVINSLADPDKSSSGIAFSAESMALRAVEETENKG